MGDKPLPDLDGEGAAAVRGVLAQLRDTATLIASPTLLPTEFCTDHCHLGPTARSPDQRRKQPNEGHANW